MKELIFEDLTKFLADEDLVYTKEEDCVRFIHLDINKSRGYTCFVSVDEDDELDFSAIWVRRIPENQIQAVDKCIKDITSRLGISFLTIYRKPNNIRFWNPYSNTIFWNMLQECELDLSPRLFDTFIKDNIRMMDDLISIIQEVLKSGTQPSYVVELSAETLKHIKERIDKEIETRVQHLRKFLRREVNKDYKIRDKIIFGQEMDWEKISCGAVGFDGLKLGQFLELLEGGFLNLDCEHNLSPTIGEFMDFMRKYPKFTARGWAISPERENYEICPITIDGIELAGPFTEYMAIDFIKLCWNADDLVVNGEGLFCWFD